MANAGITNNSSKGGPAQKKAKVTAAPTTEADSDDDEDDDDDDDVNFPSRSAVEAAKAAKATAKAAAKAAKAVKSIKTTKPGHQAKAAAKPAAAKPAANSLQPSALEAVLPDGDEDGGDALCDEVELYLRRLAAPAAVDSDAAALIPPPVHIAASDSASDPRLDRIPDADPVPFRLLAPSAAIAAPKLKQPKRKETTRGATRHFSNWILSKNFTQNKR